MASYVYDDYRLTLVARADGGYDALGRGVDGVAHHGTFRMPLQGGELEQAVLAVAGHAARGPSAVSRDVGGAAPPDIDAEELGGALAAALLTGDIAVGYDAARQRAVEQGRGVRLTLSLGDAPALLSVPWELLYRRPTFLATQRQTPVVRHLEVARIADAPAIDGAIAILGVVANPPDTAPLDVAAERARVEQAVASMVAAGQVTLDWLEPATPRGLREALRDGTYHVVHYVGHGDFTAAGEGVLYLETGVGPLGHAELDSGELASLLADQTSLRLVVLNACEGARTTLTDPFAGVATTLVQLGVAAVVAMQFAISDAAAILFAEELYTNLIGRRSPVDTAVAEARKAIFIEQGTVEWATPVLYMAATEVELWRWRDHVPRSDHVAQSGPDPVAPTLSADLTAEAVVPPPDVVRRRRSRRWPSLVGLVVVAAVLVVGWALTRGRGDGDGADPAVTAVSSVPEASAVRVAPLGVAVRFQGTIDAAGGSARHTFTAAAGQFVYVDAGGNCNPELDYQVLGPSGALVSNFQRSACVDTDRFPITADGTYTLVVASGGATGPYDLTVQPIRDDRVAAATPGNVVTGSIDQSGARDVYTYELHAGDLLYFDGVGPCAPTTSLKYQLYDSAGRYQLGFDSDACQDGGRVPIVADGTYDLVVFSYQGGTGTYAVLVTTIRPDRDRGAHLGCRRRRHHRRRRGRRPVDVRRAGRCHRVHHATGRVRRQPQVRRLRAQLDGDADRLRP